MKKSTQFILIGSGTVLLVAIILVVLFAYIIQAAPETPQPSSYTCAQNATSKTYQYTGIKIRLNPITTKKTADNKYQVKLSWEFTGLNEFLDLDPLTHKNKKGIYLIDNNYHFQEFRILNHGQAIGKVSYSENTFTQEVTIPAGQTIKNEYSISTVFCWQERNIDPFGGPALLGKHDAKSKIISNEQEITLTEKEAVPEEGRPGSGELDETMNPPSEDECESQCHKFASPLSNAVCNVKCWILDLSTFMLDRAISLMIKWSGIQMSGPSSSNTNKTTLLPQLIKIKSILACPKPNLSYVKPKIF